ncbi:unnamed protein product [Brassica oleracea var. botrytis]
MGGEWYSLKLIQMMKLTLRLFRKLKKVKWQITYISLRFEKPAKEQRKKLGKGKHFLLTLSFLCIKL